MDIEVGPLTNTMFHSPFGQDDYLWSVDECKDRYTHNDLDDVLSKLDVEVHSDPSQDFSSSLDGADQSLFDCEWMTTKLDFSPALGVQFASTCDLVETLEAGDVDKVELVCSSESTCSFFNSTSSGNSSSKESMLEDKCPDSLEKLVFSSESTSSFSNSITSSGNSGSEESILLDKCPESPEQHVPNVDVNLDDQQIQDYVDLILAGNLPDNHRQGFCDVENPSSVAKELYCGTRRSNRKAQSSVQEICNTKTKTPEQKQRKKVQNRNAATRYRCKKRSELAELNVKCSELEKENEDLHQKIESLTLETKYLKDLISDVFQKRVEQKKSLHDKIAFS